MRVPDEVGLGNAKVTLSFPAWKEGNVAPATLEVAVVQADPAAKAKPPVKPAPARLPPDRARSINNLKQIGIAFHNYHDVHGHFPPAAIHGKDGKPLLSWRVALLPYLDQDALYRQFKQDEPWDSPHNKKLLDKMPAMFSVNKDGGNRTHYQVFTGRDTVFSGPKGLKINTITDGTSNTILAVEAKKTVPWTKPDDVPYNPKEQLPALGGVVEGGFHALFADGSVHFISGRANERALRAVITRAGGEAVGPRDLSADK